MKRTQKTKRALVASIVSMAMCGALLLGTTFAWFTDSVTNTGNVITAGNLKIDATAYDLGTGDVSVTIPGVNNDSSFTFENTGLDLKSEEAKDTPIISESLWEPGQSNAKLLEIKNSGNLATNITLDFAVSDGGLEDALWFDFVRLDDDNQPDGQFTERPMNTLKTLAAATTVTLKQGEGVKFVLIYGMNEEADNAYQGKTFSASVTIMATQAPVETDGFGNNEYDATANVTSEDTLKEGLESGKFVSVNVPLTWTQGVTLSGNTEVELDLGDNAEITSTKKSVFDLNGNATLTIDGKGSIKQDFDSEEGIMMRPEGDSKLIIKDGYYLGGLTCIQAGDNAQVEIYGGHFEVLTNWKGVYWTLNLIDKTNASIKVYGGTFVNFDPSNSATEDPAANFVAEGYKVVSEQHGEDTWYTVVPE